MCLKIISATFIPILLPISQTKHNWRGRELSSSDDEVNPQEAFTSILFMAFLTLRRWSEFYLTSKTGKVCQDKSNKKKPPSFQSTTSPFLIPSKAWLASKKMLSHKKQVSKAHSWKGRKG